MADEEAERHGTVPELGVTAPGLHWTPGAGGRAAHPRRPASTDVLILQEQLADERRRGVEADAYVRRLEDEIATKHRYAASLEPAVRERDLLARRCAELEAALAAAQRLSEDQQRRLAMTRYRVADRAHATLQRLPVLHRLARLAAARIRDRRHRPRRAAEVPDDAG